MRRQPYVGIARPPFIDRERPEPLQYGRTRFRPDDAPPPSPSAGQLQLFGWLFYTWNLSNPADYGSIVSSWMKKGWSWQVWRTALEARITARGGVIGDELIDGAGAQAGLFQVRKQAVLELGSMMDLLVLGHSPPAAHIQWIKANSTAPNGTKVLSGMHDFESIGQAPHWNTASAINAMRIPFRQHVMVPDPLSGCAGNGLAAYGCPVVDKYEIQDSNGSPGGEVGDLCTGSPTWPDGYVACPHTPAHAGLPPDAIPGTKHSWDIDIVLATQASGSASQLYSDIEQALSIWLAGEGAGQPGYVYGTGSGCILDGTVWDNWRTSPFKGSASVNYPAHVTASLLPYQAAWRFLPEHVRIYFPQGFPACWGNAPDSLDVYAPGDLRGRFVEHFFRSSDGSTARTWADISAGITRCASNGVRIVLGINTDAAVTAHWAMTTGGAIPAVHGTWAQVKSLVAQLDGWDYVYAPAVAAYTGGAILWQDGWRVPS